MKDKGRTHAKHAFRRIAVVAAVLSALVGAAACEKDRTPPPPEICTKVAEQCKLPGGVLGVCNSASCKPGDTPPCLRCMPQH